MVGTLELWLPIVLAAVLVFAASSLAHMVLPYHRSDYRKLPAEDRIMEAIRNENVPPGDYAFPCPASPKDMGSPEMLERYKRGPVGLATIMPSGPPAMGKNLVLWFFYCLLVGFFVAYLTGRTLPPDTPYLRVFQIAGAAAFAGYGLGHIVDSIWKSQAWSTTIKHVFDGLIYSLLTAGVFGWLWP